MMNCGAIFRVPRRGSQPNRPSHRTATLFVTTTPKAHRKTR